MQLVFTKSQIQRMANIFDNAGQVCLATAVLTPLISNIERGKLIVVLLGLLATIALWWLSLKFERIASML